MSSIHEPTCPIPPEQLVAVQSGASGFGIRAMRERLRPFHGELRIDSDGSGTRVLVMTASERHETLVQAVGAGAAGYITKRSNVTELCEAVNTVYSGGAAVSPALTAHLLRAFSSGATTAPRSSAQLGQRELEVLRLVADGLTDDEISRRLFISARTVQAHLARVRDKTGVRRRSQLARWATEQAVL